MAYQDPLTPATGDDRLWDPNDDGAARALATGPHASPTAAIISLLDVSAGEVTLQFERDGNFRRTGETMTFRGTTYTIGHVQLRPESLQKTRITTGADFEGFIEYDVDKT